MKAIFRYSSVQGLLVLVTLVISAFHCSEDRADRPLKRSVIWRISGGELPAPSYLFGTVHRMDSARLPIHSTIIEQLRRSGMVALETDVSDPDYARKALEYAMMKSDSLEGLMSSERYDSLRTFFQESFSFPLEAVKRMKPFYVASLIGALSTGQCSESHEEEIIRVARKEGKEIAGISTLSMESGLISGIPLDDQMDYLWDAIDSYKNGQSEELKRRIMDAYENADIERIRELMSESLNDHPSVYHQLFVARNESWLPHMMEMMREESCFFAVGVGHLPGEEGLINLLRNQGFKVVPVHLDFWFHD